MVHRLLVAVLALSLTFLAVPIEASDRVPGLAGTLTDARAWSLFKRRFITAEGRVVDTGNGGISHSEGQGYGMLLAVAARDRDAFERLWGWTRANLMVRGDQLTAWRFEPDTRPAVADMNNATDGDMLIAWALVEATELWRDPAHRIAARRMAVEIGRKLIVRRAGQAPLLLPGIRGFGAEDRPDGPVVNLSYWVFPALDRLPLAAPEHDWAGLARSGLALIAGSQPLPADWTALGSGAPRPATGFPTTFGHNALRIPLYLVWAGLAEPDRHAAFLSSIGDRAGMSVVDLASGNRTLLPERGYAAIVALTACATGGRPLGASLQTPQPETEDYYPATLHLLVLVAAAMRHPRCLGPS